MNRKTIECKLITPMLMHGIQEKKNGRDIAVAELRPPAIKGAMRFWWRAIHGDLRLDELKKEESKLFGGAGEDSAVKSSFRIKLLTINLKIEQIDPLPHKNSRFRISGYRENQKFKIEFIGKDLDIVNDIFELTSILGGFGQRSRRGFGSVQVREVVNIEYIENLINKINSKFNYSNNILIRLKKMTWSNSKISLNIKDFQYYYNNFFIRRNNYPYIKNIEIGKEYSDMNSLIRTISSATHSYNKDGMFGSVQNGRYASPIYISVIKDGTKYRPIITTLNATRRIDERRLTEFKGAIL